MKIAVEGCCHGELDKIYSTVEFIEKQDNIKVDLLLICGDFQAVRNRSDLNTMAVPPKYRQMNTFWKYYSGKAKAPVLTVVIGGNHEASNYLQELPYGGWLAPNIYYMGYANIIKFGGLRIGGMSGIYKSADYNRGHYEKPPYTDNSIRSAYHVRALEVFRLKQVKQAVDIFMSHDWPRGIYDYGNTNELLRKKKFFKEEVYSGTLGSAPAEEVLKHLKPDYWFSAHLHVKFAALVKHEIPDGTSTTTKFLALDKCLPNRNFLQVIDIPSTHEGELKLELDPEWIWILKVTNHLLSLSRNHTFLPGPGSTDRHEFYASKKDFEDIDTVVGGMYKIPENFELTAPVYDASAKNNQGLPPQMYNNPQTDLLCKVLNLTNPFAVFMGLEKHDNYDPNNSVNNSVLDESENIDDSVASDDDVPSFLDSTLDVSLNTTNNPDEISLDDESDDDDEGSSAEKGDVSRLSKCSSADSFEIIEKSKPTKLETVSAFGETFGDFSPIKKPASDEPSDAPSDKEMQSSPPKKFKRRNQAMYSSQEEDGDDDDDDDDN